jgi:ATP-dependent exoDNAse (exonuclease V) alpha subunit
MKWARGHEARVLFAGDQDQLTSVDAGDFFRIILDGSGIHTAHLSEILRQEKTALDGHYLKACQLFKLGKTTEAFYELDLAGRIFEIQGKSRVQAIADAIIRSQDEGVAAMAVNPTHRENDAISEAVRIRKHERGELADERTILAHRSLGWSEAQKAEIRRIQPGQILEIIRGKGKGKAWEVVSVDGDHGIAQDYNGARWTFNASNAAMFDVCERRELKVAIGDTLLIRAGAQGKNGSITNGERLTVVGWDAEGRPVSTDGRSIVIGNLSYAYASTVYKSQGSTTMRVIPGFDRESVRNSSAQVAYTACSRGVRDLWLFVENKADLALIEKHTGIRQAATEMEIDKAGPTFRSEAQKLFDQLEQLKARQTPEHPRQAKTLREHVVNLCQKVADAIGWNQKIGEHIPDNIMKVDLQELARKMSPEQHVAAEQSHLAIMKAAQRAEQHEQGMGMEI